MHLSSRALQKQRFFNYLGQDNSFEMCSSVIYIEFPTKLTILKKIQVYTLSTVHIYDLYHNAYHLTHHNTDTTASEICQISTRIFLTTGRHIIGNSILVSKRSLVDVICRAWALIVFVLWDDVKFRAGSIHCV